MNAKINSDMLFLQVWHNVSSYIYVTLEAKAISVSWYFLWLGYFGRSVFGVISALYR